MCRNPNIENVKKVKNVKNVKNPNIAGKMCRNPNVGGNEKFYMRRLLLWAVW